MTINSDNDLPKVTAKETWDHCLARLPSMVVVELGTQWTQWLRRELRDLEIRISRQSWPWGLERPVGLARVIAWQVSIENYEQVLTAMARHRKERRRILQIALMDTADLASGYCGLREAGAFHIQSDWYSARSLKQVLRRYWDENTNSNNDPVGQVIQRLPLRSL